MSLLETLREGPKAWLVGLALAIALVMTTLYAVVVKTDWAQLGSSIEWWVNPSPVITLTNVDLSAVSDLDTFCDREGHDYSFGTSDYTNEDGRWMSVICFDKMLGSRYQVTEYEQHDDAHPTKWRGRWFYPGDRLKNQGDTQPCDRVMYSGSVVGWSTLDQGKNLPNWTPSFTQDTFTLWCIADYGLIKHHYKNGKYCSYTAESRLGLSPNRLP